MLIIASPAALLVCLIIDFDGYSKHRLIAYRHKKLPFVGDYLYHHDSSQRIKDYYADQLL